jgi:hypothetical protein
MKGSNPSAGRQRYGMFGVVGIVGLLLVAFVAWLGRPELAQANSNDLAKFTGRYPNATASCSTCHTSSIPALNAYGAAYKNNGRNASALATIEPTDSDGDGYTNLQEINAGTNPGDASSHPSAVTPQPTGTAVKTPLPSGTPAPSPTTVGGPLLNKSLFLPLITIH